MQRPNIKVLVFSVDNGFLSEQVQSLKNQFVVQRAHNLDVMDFLNKEWEPQYFALDVKYISYTDFQNLTKKTKPNTCFLLFHSGSSQQDQERYLKAGADFWMDKHTSAPNIMQTLCNHYNKWASSKIFEEAAAHAAMNDSQDKKYIEFDELKVFPAEYLVKSGEEVINTSPIQFRLLLSFINNHDQLLTRKWLQEYVWDGAKISPRSIDAQISKLKKLIPVVDTYMINVYGKGYILSSSKKHVA